MTNFVMPTMTQIQKELQSGFLDFDSKEFFLQVSLLANNSTRFTLTNTQDLRNYTFLSTTKYEANQIGSIYEIPFEYLKITKDQTKDIIFFSFANDKGKFQETTVEESTKLKIKVFKLRKKNQDLKQKLNETKKKMKGKHSNEEEEEEEEEIDYNFYSNIQNEHRKLFEMNRNLKIKIKELKNQLKVLFQEMVLTEQMKDQTNSENSLQQEQQKQVESEWGEYPLYFTDTWKNTFPRTFTVKYHNKVCTRIAKNIPNQTTLRASQTMSGRKLFYCLVQVEQKITGNGSNIGIVPVNTHDYAYKDGWVIDIKGGTCGLNGEWSKDSYASQINTGDIVGIYLDLVDGRIAFSINGRNLGWRFFGIDVEGKYQIAVDVWHIGESFQIL
ncbi:spry domain containing socs box protein [Anaeramoeba flamelloides]|uniref:Spry domain containing socs box protein n=1 Tax=Anaeramoeba flamelloides TaxID=1746091 RepID=A0ABQ8YCN7_9EUKA|nr:spry domain containing socs box protein [Anaeramoeba flamelloides]